MAFQMITGKATFLAQTFAAKFASARRLQLIAVGQGVAVLAAVAVLGFGGAQVMQAVSARNTNKAMMPAVSMTVGNGETLWSLARKYGNPSDSQLDRVDTLAKANGLPTGAMLHPGQRLVVPVENPQEATRLQVALAVR
ncbi:MAG: LysM peptidoglycan-binding domain-containing protein [Armatimonadetes bacterium]|nr:LysM peptidoglycan-binding domain-containing protein [Armatimonadota bacterium]